MEATWQHPKVRLIWVKLNFILLHFTSLHSVDDIACEYPVWAVHKWYAVRFSGLPPQRSLEWLQYLHADKVNWMTNDQAYQHIQHIYQFTYQLISLQHFKALQSSFVVGIVKKIINQSCWLIPCHLIYQNEALGARYSLNLRWPEGYDVQVADWWIQMSGFTHVSYKTRQSCITMSPSFWIERRFWIEQRFHIKVSKYWEYRKYILVVLSILEVACEQNAIWSWAKKKVQLHITTQMQLTTSFQI